MSFLGNFYNRVYDKCCGVHPNLYPWHFQWLGTKDLCTDLRKILPALKGRVLDVGCGERPYESWLVGADEYIGIDIGNSPKVDFIIDYEKPWPLDNDTFDVVLCTQVLEHAVNIGHMLGSINQVLKPGGTLIVTTPFIYNEHGSPNDYRRFSIHGLKQLLSQQYEVLETKVEGRIGSVVGLLCLNWVETITNQSKRIRLLKGLLLPLWILFCCVVNSLSCLIDKTDPTSAFYINVLLVARKLC